MKKTGKNTFYLAIMLGAVLSGGLFILSGFYGSADISPDAVIRVIRHQVFRMNSVPQPCGIIHYLEIENSARIVGIFCRQRLSSCRNGNAGYHAKHYERTVYARCFKRLAFRYHLLSFYEFPFYPLAIRQITRSFFGCRNCFNGRISCRRSR